MAELKVSPIATRLRSSILQQAVEGRLVPQDPAEGTADELLEQIREQRAELVRQKKAKVPKGGESRIYQGADGSWYERCGKGEPKCIDEEIPFDIPESWAWARFTQVVPVLYGYAFESELFSSAAQIGLIRIRDVNSGDLIRTETGYMGHYSLQYVVHAGDALIGMDGDFRCRQWAGPDALLNQRVCKLEPYEGVNLDFLLCVMDWYLREINKKTGGTTVKHLSAKALNNLLFAVPPTDEQERIVARFTAVMPLVDKLEIRERESNAVDSAFWRRLSQSILQEAVQGRLVPQDDADEPADLLLEQIRAQRAELVKQKKAKAPKGGESRIYRGADGSWYEQRGKGETKCIDEEIPFDIPESWAWARLGNVCVLERGSGIKRGEVTPEGWPCVRYGELYTTYKHEIREVASKTTEEIFNASHKLLPDEVLITLTGENKVDIGRAVVNTTGETLAYGGDLAALKYHGQYGRFLMFLINSSYVGSLRTKTSTGDTIVHLSAKKAEEFLIPVPPLAEQERIVVKIDEVMSLLDQAS